MALKIFDDLAAFAVVAREQSFTKAAARLGVAQSSLSQTVKNLEDKLQMRLLSRSTRKVSPTELGAQLLQYADLHLTELENAINHLRGQAERPAGTVRITSSAIAAERLLWPRLMPLLEEFPDLNVEISADASLTDIIEERFDAGVRLGEHIEKDMVAVRIGPMERMVVVGAPSYFERHAVPTEPHDLMAHDCILTRMPTSKAILPWDFEKDGREVKVRVSGRIICNSRNMQIDAVRRGLGLAWMMEHTAEQVLEGGEAVKVLDDWCAPFPGFHLYYPSRHRHTPAFALVIDRLRWRDP